MPEPIAFSFEVGNRDACMSRYWLMVQLAMAALFAVMAVIMAVVLLSYTIYIDADPRMARDLPFLTQVAAGFVATGLVFAAGSWSQWRGHWSRWLLWLPEFAVLLALFGMIRSMRVVD
jgi:Ca2+/Na+ antiporter